MSIEGKGWVLVSGVLMIVTLFLAISNIQQSNKVKELEARLASPAPTTEPIPEATESPSGDPSPDVSTPEKRDAVRKAELGQIKVALTEYQKAKGQYPASLNMLVPDYLEAVPTDPLAPKYTYRYQKIGNGFRLTAFMENKADADDGRDGKKDQIYVVTPTTP